MELRLCLLGRFELRAGDKVVVDRTWSRRKAAALLKLLALHPARSLHREQVLDVLWPDLDPAAAANNLHKTLHYLRAAFAGHGVPATTVELARDAVVLASAVWIDWDAFRTHAAATRGSGDPESLAAALAYYGGPLLPEDLYEDWTEPARQGLQALYLELLAELAQVHETRGQPAQAIPCWRQLLETDPLHEPAHRALMRLYAQSGRRHDALRQYQACRTALERELGVAPAAETEALFQAIATGHAAAWGVGERTGIATIATVA
ncbi:MAG: AfsR/SARP family transcriptional regulator, partial [Chloroflexota bacterium]